MKVVQSTPLNRTVYDGTVVKELGCKAGRPMVQIPVRALKKKKVCDHTTMWWCDGTLAFSLQKCDYPPNFSHSNWCASWDKASTPHMVCYSHFIFYSEVLHLPWPKRYKPYMNNSL